jgi:phage tail sheath protein FI
MDDMYAANINPLVAFPQNGPTVWGQKTVLATESAFERVNVRRLLISVRRDVKKVAQRIVFEQNRDTTLERFRQLVNPILKRVQDQKGLDGFRVDIDSTTTSQADIENKTIRGQIWIQPTKTIEFMSLDFVIRNAGASL